MQTISPLSRAYACALALAASIMLAPPAALAADSDIPVAYALRPEGADAQFLVEVAGGRHWRMRFAHMTARLERAGDGMDLGSVAVQIETASVESNAPLGAAFVKSRAVLDVARYPSIRFVSTRYTRTSEAAGKLSGLLTIRSITEPIELAVTLKHPNTDSGMQDVVAFTASGGISRAAFGLLRWATSISDEVQLRIQGEFVRSQPPRPSP